MAKKKIELTEEQFRELSTDIAAELCMEASEHGVNGLVVAAITAMFSAKLDTALFEKDELEVEE